jgi:hypothetical protein
LASDPGAHFAAHARSETARRRRALSPDRERHLGARVPKNTIVGIHNDTLSDGAVHFFGAFIAPMHPYPECALDQ